MRAVRLRVIRKGSGVIRRGSEPSIDTDYERRAFFRREFSRRMESLRQEVNSPQQLQPIRRGWKLGAEDFLDWILDKIEVSTKEAHPSLERDETEQAKALRIVQKELKRLGW